MHRPGARKGGIVIRSVLMRCGLARRGRAGAALAAGCIAVALGLGTGSAAAAAPVLGLDVSGHQPIIDWSAVSSGGAGFVYVKATEGLAFVNPDFASQYDGSYQAGLIRGAYHFALPNVSSGAAQASYFVANGGGWSADGRTLPGALDVEPNPYGAKCYGLGPSAMVAWIADFADTYHALTTRWPVIYTTSAWWVACTGSYDGFAAQDPLWFASYGPAPGPLPGGWSTYTFWQDAPSGAFPGDQDIFNGTSAEMTQFVTGS
jgi:GH25 family lysozyme M1 (1,4-beta-N-acetylmuramidase)